MPAAKNPRPAIKTTLASLMAAGLLVVAASAQSAEPAAIQHAFNQRYQPFFGADSSSLLPLPAIDRQEWKRMLAKRALRQVYQEPDKYYNSKVYVFTLYQDEEGGAYYLDATGGFWGMDELVYMALCPKGISACREGVHQG